jgi:hypothetical protein
VENTDTQTTPVEETAAPKSNLAKLLSFTVVTGYLKGNHACPFELHATGCKDLKAMQRTQPHYEVLAEGYGHALDVAVEDAGGRTKRTDYWVQPCCSPARMRAAGRA